MSQAHFTGRDGVLVLAYHLRALGPMTCRLGGVLGFVLEGYGGGYFEIDLDHPGGKLHILKAPSERATTLIYAPAEEFAQLFIGAPDQRRLSLSKMQVLGERPAFSEMGRLILSNEGRISPVY